MEFDERKFLYSALIFLAICFGSLHAQSSTTTRTLNTVATTKPVPITTTRPSISTTTTKPTIKTATTPTTPRPVLISTTRPSISTTTTKPTIKTATTPTSPKPVPVTTTRPSISTTTTKPTIKTATTPTTPKPVPVTTTRPSISTTTTQPKICLTGKTSTTSAITTPVTAIETTTSICKHWGDIPFIAVTACLAICVLGYIVLAAVFMTQRCRRKPSTSDAENIEDAKNTNDYTSTPTVSAPLYENFQLQIHLSGSAVQTYEDDANPYQQLSNVDRPQTIYEALFKKETTAEYCV